MAAQWKLIIAVAVIVIAAAFIWGGRYTISAQGARVFIVDRFTGSVRVCTSDECTIPRDLSAAVNGKPLEKRPPLSSFAQPQQWPGTPVPETGPWTQFQKPQPNSH